MRERWLRISILGAVLFAINVVARLVARFGFHGTDKAEDRSSLAMLVAIGVLYAVVAFVWGQRRPLGAWLAESTGAAVGGLLLTIFVGPFISGSSPFKGGAGVFFSQVWLYAAFTGGGALIGFLIATAFGWDYRSRSLQRYAETRSAKPRRVIRR
ncbi:MAG TPA: hypothetical protein VGJ63_14660 [Micromonosporaceae bacterium]|jgi:hypothetical protein